MRVHVGYFDAIINMIKEPRLVNHCRIIPGESPQYKTYIGNNLLQKNCVALVYSYAHTV